MKKLNQAIHLIFLMLIVANIVWIIRYWESQESYNFIGFMISKYYYLPLQFLFAWAFYTGLAKTFKKEDPET